MLNLMRQRQRTAVYKEVSINSELNTQIHKAMVPVMLTFTCTFVFAFSLILLYCFILSVEPSNL